MKSGDYIDVLPKAIEDKPAFCTNFLRLTLLAIVFRVR